MTRLREVQVPCGEHELSWKRVRVRKMANGKSDALGFPDINDAVGESL